MRKCLLFLFVIVSVFVKGQACNGPSQFPTDIYYPNTVTTPTNVQGFEYLCGPNTIVFDTINSGCHFICVNASCTLAIKYMSCAAIGYVWLKNGGTLNILQGTSPFQIFYETGAVINNSFSVAVSSSSCATISFPTVNCNVTSLSENNSNSTFNIYPNPTNEVINLDLKNFTSTENYFVKIVNILDQNVMDCKFEKTLNISSLKNGIYFLQLFDKEKLIATEKIIKE